MNQTKIENIVIHFYQLHLQLKMESAIDDLSCMNCYLTNKDIKDGQTSEGKI